MKQELKPDQNWLDNQMVSNLASAFTRYFTKEAGKNVYKEDIQSALTKLTMSQRIEIALSTLTIDCHPKSELSKEKLSRYIELYLNT